MFFLQVIVVLLAIASRSHGLNYCVSESKTCSQSFNCTQHCQPLMWYVNNTENIENNTEIIFLPGNHNLNSSGQSHAVLSFTDKQGLNLTGHGINVRNSSTIVCNGNQSGVLLKHSTNIHIYGITFQNCQFPLSNKTSALSLIHSTNITISHVSITHYLSKPVGNILFRFESPQLQNASKTSLLEIEHCNFLFRDHGQKGKGLYLKITTPRTIVSINNITVMNSSSKYGGNIEIVTIDFNEYPNQFTICNSNILNGKAESGGGISFVFEKHIKLYKHNKLQTIVKFNNTVFESNVANASGGALKLETDDFQVHSNFTFYNCTFQKNLARTGGAILIQALRAPTNQPHTGPKLSVIMENCTVNENNLPRDSIDHRNGNEVVCFYDIDKAIIKNTNFTNNNGTALLLVSTTVIFKENTLFSNNRGVYGGALRLCDKSMFYVYNKTNIQFQNNSATVSGGAIHAENNCIQLVPICFYQVESKYTRPILNFTNNTAQFSGDAIYGGSIDTCYLLETYYTRQHKKELAHKIFQIQPKSVSMVASDPYRVCLCNNKTKAPNCSVTETEMGPHYPGETFTVYVAAIGQRYGTVPAILVLKSQFNFTHNYDVPNADKCQSIQLTVFSAPNVTASIVISLSQNIHTKHFSNSDLTINVPIVPCPWIFELSEGDQGYFCNCSKFFTRDRFDLVSCNITSMTINRKGTNWIDCEMQKNFTDSKKPSPQCDNIIIGRYCQHCDFTKQYFTPHNLSDQCIEGREGRLCGHCKANYSFSLGPPICIENEKCSMWKTITLLIAFFLAGIIFVCFLAVLNITVTEGTVNGMLLYTTFIHSNQDLYFQESYNGYEKINKVLTIIFSWFNLDFGITVCFYQGMSASIKHCLEFTFILYLLLIGLLIVFLSRRSAWFTRLAGRNIVPVLSTVLLFSCSKIISICARVLNCFLNSYMSTKNETRLIWAEDETIDCFTGVHIPLALCSMLFLVATFFYNFCLLFSQCLQRRSHWWVLRWVNKLRPFFDTNTGICRDEYRFWPGFVLLLRLAMTIYANTTRTIRLQHRLITVAAVGFLSLTFFVILPRGVYKKWPLIVLEVWLLSLLVIPSIVLASGTHYNIGCVISIATIIAALATFLFIFLYHFYKVVSQTKGWKNIAAKVQAKYKKLNITDVNEVTPILHPVGMPPVIHFAQPREPLLEDNAET